MVKVEGGMIKRIRMNMKKLMYKYLIDKIMKENTFAICESNFIIGMKKGW